MLMRSTYNHYLMLWLALENVTIVKRLKHTVLLAFFVYLANVNYVSLKNIELNLEIV